MRARQSGWWAVWSHWHQNICSQKNGISTWDGMSSLRSGFDSRTRTFRPLLSHCGATYSELIGGKMRAWHEFGLNGIGAPEAGRTQTDDELLNEDVPSCHSRADRLSGDAVTLITRNTITAMNKSTLCFCAASLIACGTIPFNTSAAEPATLEPSAESPLYRPWSLGLEAGTTGLGGFLSWRFADHWGVRSGFDYFQYCDSGFAIKDLSYNAKIRLMSEPLTLDIYPWKEHSFHVSVGMQFNQNQLTGTAEDAGTIIPPEKLGTLDLKIEQALVNPYVSIGGNLFYFDHAHHWAFGGELGVTYTGDPTVSLTRSGPPSALLDAALRYEEGQIKDYADKFKWWPVLKIMVSYSF